MNGPYITDRWGHTHNLNPIVQRKLEIAMNWRLSTEEVTRQLNEIWEQYGQTIAINDNSCLIKNQSGTE